MEGEAPLDEPGAWLRVGEAARRLGKSERRLRQLADSGKLVALRTPLGRLISARSVEEYKRNGPPEGGSA